MVDIAPYIEQQQQRALSTKRTLKVQGQSFWRAWLSLPVLVNRRDVIKLMQQISQKKTLISTCAHRLASLAALALLYVQHNEPAAAKAYMRLVT